MGKIPKSVLIISIITITGCLATTTKNEYILKIDSLSEIARNNDIERINPDFLVAFEEMQSEARRVCQDVEKRKECKLKIEELENFLNTVIKISKKQRKLNLYSINEE
jgi:tRNA A37 methylthiotransferase MiaB